MGPFSRPLRGAGLSLQQHHQGGGSRKQEVSAETDWAPPQLSSTTRANRIELLWDGVRCYKCRRATQLSSTGWSASTPHTGDSGA